MSNNSEEYSPFLYTNQANPSAPPLYASDVRIVQPFEIAHVDAYSVPEHARQQNSNTQHQYVPANRNVVVNGGKVESAIVQQQVKSGNRDGDQIVMEDSTAKSLSNSAGVTEHRQIVQKVIASNADYVHELGGSLANISVPIAEAEKGVVSDTKILEQAPQRTGGGYQISEYKSIYDSEGGYKSSDYKSIYD
jgi:hypothetical protein